MKTFIPNKKWVMTGALLAVLGVNVSFKTHKYGIATADFASTAMEFRDEEIATAEGIQNVRYVQIEEGKVLALKKDTEGKVCYDCAARSFKIDNANLADLKNLNVKYLQEISKLPTPPTAKPEEKITPIAGEEGDEQISNGALDKVLDQCKKKEGSEKLSCLSSKFLTVLKGKKAEGISPEEATEFFKSEIAPLIADQIKEARHTSLNKFKAMVGINGNNLNTYRDSEFSDFEDEMADNDYSSDDPKEMLDAALEIVRDIHASIPRRFTDIRKELVKTEKEILVKHVRDIEQSARQAEQRKNTYEGLALRQQTTLLQTDLDYVVKKMQAETRSGLSEALSDGLLSRADRSAHEQAFQLASNGLRNSVNKFIDQWNITGRLPMTDASIYNGSDIPVGVDLSGRLNGTATRGGVIVLQQSNTGLSNRNSMNLSSTAAATPAVDPSTGNLVWVIPTNNTGVDFGTPVPLTQANSAFLEQMRAQQNVQRGN